MTVRQPRSDAHRHGVGNNVGDAPQRPASDLTQVALTRAIARLAWPAMGSVMLVNVFTLIDAFWVGRLGTHALGGMTASAFVVWAMHAGGHLVGHGLNAVVARRVGEGRPHAAGVAVAAGLALAVVVAAVLSGVGLVAQRPLFAALGLATEVQEQARLYLTPVLYGLPAVTVWFAVEATYRGSGDTRTPMVVLCATLLFNAALDPVLIFGVGSWPGMGIAGAAWATVLAHGLGVAWGLVLLQRRDVRPRRRETAVRLPLATDASVHAAQPTSLQLVGTIARIGAPIGISAFLFSLIYVALTRVIAGYGDAPIAALGIGHRVEGLPFFAGQGFAAAAATLVGQHLGARQPRRAMRAAWLAAGMASAAVAFMSVCCFAFAPWIVSVFADDAEVVAHGTAYLRIIALFEVGMAVELVLEGAFSAAGNSLPPMLVSVPLTALRIPLAYALAGWGGLGPTGVWWAISVTAGLKGVVLAWWFRLGHWQSTRF